MHSGPTKRRRCIFRRIGYVALKSLPLNQVLRGGRIDPRATSDPDVVMAANDRWIDEYCELYPYI